MSLWETIDELLDDSSSILNSNISEVSASHESRKSNSNDIFNEDELDQNELLGLIDEEDDFGLLSQEDETNEKAENEKIENQDIQVSEEPKTIFESEAKCKIKETNGESKTNEKNLETRCNQDDNKKNELKTKTDKQEEKLITENVKDNNHDKVVKKAHVQKKTKYQDNKKQNFNRNNGILPIPTNFKQPNFQSNNLGLSNIPQQSSLIFQATKPQIMPNFNQQYNQVSIAPFPNNPINQLDFYNQQQNFSNYQPHKPINQINSIQFNHQIQSNANFIHLQPSPIIQNQMTQPHPHFNQPQFFPMNFNQPQIQPFQFQQSNIIPQAPKQANSVYINPSFFPKQQQQIKEHKKEQKNEHEPKVGEKNPNHKRSRKDLDLLLEQRLAAELEKEKIEENLNKKKEAIKRKSNETQKCTPPPNKLPKVQESKNLSEKTESESIVLADDPEYLKKLEEQKQKRLEILRLKEEKRNQRFKTSNAEKNENIPVKMEPKRTVIQTRESLGSSDNRIIQTSTTSSSNNSQTSRIVVKNLSLSTNEKKLLNMCNSINIKEKVNETNSLLVFA